ncbi:MAG: hypothetical protein H7301_13280 [Cryobacterium sp.]|nr:hypothetical protein [Oligoflexia bacterium]
MYRLLSFGHVTSAVDWLLIRFITDGNLTHVEAGKEPEIARVLELATDLDPLFFSLYTAGANFLSIVRNEPKSALKLIEKGNEFYKKNLAQYPDEIRNGLWSDAWRLTFTLGYLQLFEFQNMAKAIAAYDEMRKTEHVPTVLRKMAESIQTPEGQFRIGLNALSFMKKYHEADEVMSAELAKKEKAFMLAKDLYFWNLAFNTELKNPASRNAESFFPAFRIKVGIPARDAFGGEIFYNRTNKRIETQTPSVPVLGLELAKAPVVKPPTAR